MAIDQRAPEKISRRRSLDEWALDAVGACNAWPLASRLAASAAIVLAALAFRFAFLAGLGPRIAYVTFFPRLSSRRWSAECLAAFSPWPFRLCSCIG